MLRPYHSTVSYKENRDTFDSITARLYEAWWLQRILSSRLHLRLTMTQDAKKLAPESEESDFLYIGTPLHDAALSNKFWTRFTAIYLVLKVQGLVGICKSFSAACKPIGLLFIVKVKGLKKSMMLDELSTARQYDHQLHPALRRPVSAPRAHW